MKDAVSRQQDASPYLAHAVLDNPVGLVTSFHEGQRNVMTASFFAESSHVPALVRLSVAISAWTHELISRSGWFGLHLLARQQAELAWQCGIGTGRDQCRFERSNMVWRPGPNDVPLLPACLTTSACQVVERHELPGHTLFVGRIVASFRQSRVAYRRVLLVSDLIDFLKQG